MTFAVVGRSWQAEGRLTHNFSHKETHIAPEHWGCPAQKDDSFDLSFAVEKFCWSGDQQRPRFHFMFFAVAISTTTQPTTERPSWSPWVSRRQGDQQHP
jgi:hypothetical protein